jgi:hypothetical protein
MTEQDHCTDDELAYERLRTVFAPGAPLRLDETYCLAHLPLVNPAHPRALASKPGTYYESGRHPVAFSLVLPIPGEELRRAPAYAELTADLRAAPFGSKIAWRIVEARQHKLHATVCGSLSTGEPPVISDEAGAALRGIGPISVEVRGLFSGNVNRGRLYLRVYPERRGTTNVFHDVQRALGRPLTDLYVVGVWNLTEDLTAAETDALAGLIDRWWDRTIFRFQADRFWLLGARDDLVLDSSIAEEVRLR